MRVEKRTEKGGTRHSKGMELARDSPLFKTKKGSIALEDVRGKKENQKYGQGGAGIEVGNQIKL